MRLTIIQVDQIEDFKVKFSLDRNIKFCTAISFIKETDLKPNYTYSLHLKPYNPLQKSN